MNGTMAKIKYGRSATGIVDDDDETLTLGITPKEIAVEVKENINGILYRKQIDTLGILSWTQCSYITKKAQD